MGILVVIILVIIALSLFWIAKKDWINNKNLQLSPKNSILISNDDATTIDIRFICNYQGKTFSPI